MKLTDKYRPKSFDQLVGDYSYILPLLDKSQSFLFEGGAGCGKTTSARLVASHLGALPTDILEINAAEDRQADVTQKTLELVGNMPSGKAWVVIFDEAHRLTATAVDLLLKPVEEPGKYLYWIFCSSNPVKLPPALRTRLSNVHFSPLSEEALMVLLQRVKKEEGFDLPNASLSSIATKAKGSARQALNDLELVQTMTINQREQYLRQEEDSPTLLEFLRAVWGKNWPMIVSLYDSIKLTEEPEVVRRALFTWGLNSLRRSYAIDTIKKISYLEKEFMDWNQLLLAIAKMCM